MPYSDPVGICWAFNDLLTADMINRFSPDWSPKGSRILFGWSTLDEGWRLAWVRPDGSGLETLELYAGQGRFSPDGTQIAFVASDLSACPEGKPSRGSTPSTSLEGTALDRRRQRVPHRLGQRGGPLARASASLRPRPPSPRWCMQGQSTRQMARVLALSPLTVQDHLRSNFARTGVRTRSQLVGQVFLEHYVPR